MAIMTSKNAIIDELNNLLSSSENFRIENKGVSPQVDPYDWQMWTQKCLNLLKSSFGDTSDCYIGFRKIVDSQVSYDYELKNAKGILSGTLDSYKKGFIKEIKTLSILSDFKNGNKSLNYNSIDFQDQDDFNPDEKSQIKQSITELKTLIYENIAINIAQQKIVEERLNYLADAVDRLNKYDWRNALIGIFLDICVALTLDTTKGQLLFEFFRQAFSVVTLLIAS